MEWNGIPCNVPWNGTEALSFAQQADRQAGRDESALSQAKKIREGVFHERLPHLVKVLGLLRVGTPWLVLVAAAAVLLLVSLCRRRRPRPGGRPPRRERGARG